LQSHNLARVEQYKKFIAEFELQLTMIIISHNTLLDVQKGFSCAGLSPV